MSYLADIARLVRNVVRNEELRRVEFAFIGFNAAEWGVWLAMLVFAYHHGGATTAGLVAVAQLAPAGIFAPFFAALADRYPPARVLTFGYLAQAVALGATATALETDASPYLAYALAACAATLVTLTRPTQATLVPALARTPDELTAANVVSGWIESGSVLAGPALTGVLLAVSTPGTVFAVMAVLLVGSGAFVFGLRGPAPIRANADALAETVAGFRLLRADRDTRIVTGVVAAQYVAIGALDVLFVVLSFAVLHLGGSGAGYLNAAFGAGGVIGIGATAALVGRARLVPPLLIGVVVWGLAFLIMGLRPTTALAFAMLVAAGVGRTVVDVAGRTLLQRVAQQALLARVFGVLEGAAMGALMIGSLLTPLIVAVLGARAAIICLGCVLPVVVLWSGRHLLAVDRRAMAPVVEIGLLRSLPTFASLPAPELEGLARALEPVGFAAGEIVIREGDRADRFYIVADGEVSVSTGRVLRRADGFGEIALLRDVARTATVSALTDVRLYALAKEPFVELVTGHAVARVELERIAADRIAVPT